MRIKIHIGLVAAAMALPTPTADAQQPRVLKFDLVTRMTDSVLPFDQIFLIRVAKAGTRRVVRLRYGQYDAMSYSKFKGEPADIGPLSLPDFDEVAFKIEPLTPYKSYLFEFEVQDTNGSSWNIDMLAKAAASITDHFDSDFGVLASPGPGYVGGGYNLHIYAVPISKRASPDTRRKWQNSLIYRTSVFAGVTFAKLRADRSVDNLFDLGNPTAGIGFLPFGLLRLPALDFFRLDAGLMWFNQTDANPLIVTKRNKRAFVYGVTGDVSLNTLLGPLAGLLGFKK